jgi:3-oxoacyl-[acyl-carrier-protein] synthase-3
MTSSINIIEYYLPNQIESNEYLQNKFPNWDIKKVEKKSGVFKRHIASNTETALDLSIKACEKIFKNYDKSKIDGIIYCTQSPDYIMPSNAFLLQKHFNIKEQIIAYDFNHACTGYIYGLMMANSFIKSNTAQHLLLVNADTYSKYINPKDRSTRVLFGDAAAVTIIEQSSENFVIEDIEIASCGIDYDKFIIMAGGARFPKTELTELEYEDALGNIKSQNDIKMDGFAVWSFINTKVPIQINKILDRNFLKISDIDLFIFHQASLMTLTSLIKSLKISESKVFINISAIGNTVSASIPIALKDANDKGLLKTGMKVVLSGFGVGLSYGTILIKI